MPDLRAWGPMTVLVLIVAAIVVAVGGIVVIVNPDTLTFEDYLDALWKVALAAAGLGVGRGYLKGKQAEAGATAVLDEDEFGDPAPPPQSATVPDPISDP